VNRKGASFVYTSRICLLLLNAARTERLTELYIKYLIRSAASLQKIEFKIKPCQIPGKKYTHIRHLGLYTPWHGLTGKLPH